MSTESIIGDVCVDLKNIEAEKDKFFRKLDRAHTMCKWQGTGRGDCDHKENKSCNTIPCNFEDCPLANSAKGSAYRFIFDIDTLMGGEPLKKNVVILAYTLEEAFDFLDAHYEFAKEDVHRVIQCRDVELYIPHRTTEFLPV
jgi:hypothetical protein